MWSIVIRDGLKSLVSGSRHLRQWVRKIQPYRSWPQNDDLALLQGLQIVSSAHNHGLTNGVIMEVGTGWISTIPHLFLAAGAQRILLTDIERLADEQTFTHGRKLAATKLQSLSDKVGTEKKTLCANLSKPDHFDYRCPPRTEELASDSIDLIYSRTVLEHIEPETLVQLQQEW